MDQSANPYRPPVDPLAPPPPPMQPDWVEREIAANAQLNLGMVVIGIVYPVMGPASIYRGNRALTLIKQYGVGMQYAVAAKRVRLIGYVLTALWGGVLAYFWIMKRSR